MRSRNVRRQRELLTSHNGPRLRAGALLVSIQYLHLSKHNSATFDTQPIRASWICPSELWPCVFMYLCVRFCSLRKHALLFAVRSQVSHWCRSKIGSPKASWGGTILSQPIRPTLRHLAVSICHWLQFGNFPGFATTFWGGTILSQPIRPTLRHLAVSICHWLQFGNFPGFAITLRFSRHRPVPQAMASVCAYAFFQVAYGDRPYPRLGGHFARLGEATRMMMRRLR
jgi:hypothetical protein